ncbi:MAG: four helix bundle protein [Lentisphaerae bacterium]|nr:four helix bundle protein [Lentisphaerota bacterium]
MTTLFDKSGGYRKLASFSFATLIHLATIRFCKRFIPYKDDPLGKTTGQMVGAARSGRQNIIEGSERAATSKETEMKLTDVARASLGELLGDIEMFLAERDSIPWSVRSEEHRAVSALNFDSFVHTDDLLHDYWTWFHGERKAFAPWLDHEDPVVVANALLILIRRAMAMLGGQIRHQGEAFLEEGGFRERLTQCRVEARAAAPDTLAPPCPECGKTMIQRTARKGSHAGQPFWSCPAYPDCRGTRPIEKP